MGDTVTIWDLAACGNCASAFAISDSRSADSLYIMQTATVTDPATCECLFDLRVSIVGLPAGAYMAVIARDFRWRFLYPDPRLVGAIQFEYSRGLPATSLRAYSKVVVFPVQ
jgi:hypothetical protein